MIGLLRAAAAAVLATAWYGLRILWPAARGSAVLPRRCEECPRAWARMILRWTGTRVEVEHAERIVEGRPQILVANHVSWFDVLALAGHLPGSYRFVAKKELAGVPVFGPAWLACGHISIDRQDLGSAIESLAEARRRLEREGPTVILFPEGTRSESGELRPFKKGAFVLAIETGVEVVPAALLGTREIMRKGRWGVRTGRTIRVRIGEPIPVLGLGKQDRDDLARRARDAVAALLASPDPKSL